MTDVNNLQQDHELGWDDEIEKESEFIILPEGDYNFTVGKVERGRFNGSEKMPACYKATVTLMIHSDQGDVPITHNLFLHTKTEGLLSAFFMGIGQKKKGEKLRMNWGAVTGSKGRCKLEVRKFISNKSGEELQSNEVKKFYEPTGFQPAQQAPQASQTNYQAPPAQQPYAAPQNQAPFPTQAPPANQSYPPTGQGGFTPGAF